MRRILNQLGIRMDRVAYNQALMYGLCRRDSQIFPTGSKRTRSKKKRRSRNSKAKHN